MNQYRKDKTKTKQKIRPKGKKIAKPTGTYHQRAKKLHQRVTDHLKKTTKEERMQECTKNGEMHSNKIREIIRKKYKESLITLNPNNKPKNLKKKQMWQILLKIPK